MHRACGRFLITGVGEVNSCNGACLDGDGFHDWYEAFVPGLKRVCSGRYFVDLERAHRIADSEIRVRHNADVRVHPIVDVAFDVKHDFFILRLELINQSGSRLRNVEPVVLAGQAVNVVHEGVAVLDLNGLAYARADDSRRVDASVLIDDDRLSRDRSLRDVSLQPDEDIRQAAVNCRNDVFLHDPFAGVHPGTHRIHAHPDNWIARQLSGETNVAFDRASALRKAVRSAETKQ